MDAFPELSQCPIPRGCRQTAHRHSSPNGNSGGPNTKCNTRLGVSEVAFDFGSYGVALPCFTKNV